MSDNNGFPSMTALLGLLAVAGYQNRDKLAEWFGGGHTRPANAGGAPDAPLGLDSVLGRPGSTVAAGGVGSLLGAGIGELIERFKQAGRGETANSWVESGPNEPVSEQDLAQVIGPDTMDRLAEQTGLSRQEILDRLSKRLPDAIDQYTPEGRVVA